MESEKLQCSEEEVASYLEFWRGILGQQWPDLKGLTLWHYTTGQGLIDILTSGNLWATQISCLNDRSEFIYALELIRAAFWRREDGQTLSAPQRALMSAIRWNLQDVEAVAARVEWFVTCFSSERDDLSQWRAYAGGENGYAIGFDASRIHLGAARDLCGHLAMVDYNHRSHMSKAEMIATYTISFFESGLAARDPTAQNPQIIDQWLEVFLKAWVDLGTYAPPVWKDAAFASEKEWRVVRRLRPNDVNYVKFRQKASLMSRHLPLSYSLDYLSNNAPSALPIREIVVGPTRSPKISRVSVGDLLRASGFPDGAVIVTSSTIPLRAP